MGCGAEVFQGLLQSEEVWGEMLRGQAGPVGVCANPGYEHWLLL